MKTGLMTFAGSVLGAIVGGTIGVLVGELAVDLFDISCFEGACGYAVMLLYMPVGILIGAVGGGILAYRLLRSKSKTGVWLYVLVGLMLGWIAAWVINSIAGRGLAWSLNTGVLNEANADVVLFIFNNFFGYGVMILAILGGGLIFYRWGKANA